MKRIVLIFVLVLVGFCAWLFLKKNTQSSLVSMPIQETNLVLPPPWDINLTAPVAPVSNLPTTAIVSQPTNPIKPIGDSINALAVTNLDQWKAMIPGLKYSDKFIKFSSWVMEQTNRLVGIPVYFEENDKTVSYKIRFIDVDVYNDGSEKVMEVNMHSPIMNIDETQELGLQLCNMLGVDPKDFLAWCNKVGNHWLDAPLYAAGKGAYGFQILNTFDNQRPWYINFIIQNP